MVLMLTACGNLTQTSRTEAPEQPVAVDMAIARLGSLHQKREYSGTTRPAREILVRSQTEGQILNLNVNVGDTVKAGQALARIDDQQLAAAIQDAQSQLTSLQSELASSQNQIIEAEGRVTEAELKFQQTQADSQRFQKLLQEGAISQQQAEQSQTAARSAAQALQSAQERVNSQQQSLSATQKQIAAQKATLAKLRQQGAVTVLKAPLSGVVLERSAETGNAVQPGSEVLKLGDLNQVKVVVELANNDLPTLRIGQAVPVKFPDLPQQEAVGRISRIAPAKGTTARLVPVEVTIPNPTGQIKSGFTASVLVTSTTPTQRVLIPQAALKIARGDRPSPQTTLTTPAGDRPLPKLPNQKSVSPQSPSPGKPPQVPGTIFVIVGQQPQSKVVVRQVVVGEQSDGQAEILSGLQAGEQVVVRSPQLLKEGLAVRLSAASAK
jgi:multidrug efflux pump subunit AcrA (membrane-fusion protein)